MKWLGFGLVLAFLVGPIAYQQAQQPLPEQLQAELPPIEVHFAPKGGCTEAVVKEINAAKTSILVQAYSFTSTPIAAALVAAHKRGVKVEVILDKSNRTNSDSAADFVQLAGIPTLIDAKHALAHNNVIILDGQAVVTGSLNFASADEENNAENLLVIRDALIAAQYTANWKEHSQHSVKYEAPDAGDSETVGLVKPAVFKTAAVEPTTPVDEPAKKGFASIAGRWHLSYAVPDGSRFSQELIIDSNGNYFVTTRGSSPFFLLRDIFYDPTWRIVTFSKVYARGAKKGKPAQVEVLKIARDGNSMTGHAQFDGHSLEYTRVTNQDRAIVEQGTAVSSEQVQHSDKDEGKGPGTSEAVGPVTPAAAEPTVPLDEPAKKLFASIAGRWHLSYQASGGLRTEVLSIDGNGNYFVTNRGTAPYFLLRDVFYDPTWRIVIFSKFYVQGPRKGENRQVEILKIAPDGNSMKGHVQRDGHSVEYTRVAN